MRSHIPVEVPVPFILASLAIFFTTADCLAYLFKKYHQGNWATKLRDLEPETSIAARCCCFCCAPLSAFIAMLLYQIFGVQNMLTAAIFLFVAHLSYRVLIAAFNRYAGKLIIFLEQRIGRSKWIQRFFSASIAKFALSVAGLAIYLLREKICSFCAF